MQFKTFKSDIRSRQLLCKLVQSLGAWSTSQIKNSGGAYFTGVFYHQGVKVGRFGQTGMGNSGWLTLLSPNLALFTELRLLIYCHFGFLCLELIEIQKETSVSDWQPNMPPASTTNNIVYLSNYIAERSSFVEMPTSHDTWERLSNSSYSSFLLRASRIHSVSSFTISIW